MGVGGRPRTPGAAAGDPTGGYDGGDLDTWHLVVLDSNRPEAGGCAAGTGDSNHAGIETVAPNRQVRNADTFGVLRMVLHPTGYDWSFVPGAGGSLHASASAGYR